MFVAAQVVVVYREFLLRLRTAGKPVAEERERAFELRSYIFALPAVVVALTGPGRAARDRIVAAVVLGAALVVIAFVVGKREDGRVLRFTMLAVAAGVLAVVMTCREETWRFLAAAAVPFLLTVRNLIEQWRRSPAPVESA